MTIQAGSDITIDTGENGKYHWKTVFEVAPDDLIFFDVVWGEKDQGMYVRPAQGTTTKPFIKASSRGFIELHKVGELIKENDARLREIVYEAYLPQYTMEDHNAGLDCQTWTLDVFQRLVSEGFLSKDSLTRIRKVPRLEN